MSTKQGRTRNMSDSLYLPENYIPAIGAAIGRAIERFDDPYACGESIAACFARALVDDYNIEAVIPLIDAEREKPMPKLEQLLTEPSVLEVGREATAKIEAGLQAASDGRVVERKRPQ